ncbi:MAG: hypothetical protein ABEI06_00625, partial [Halobacteriaceae archaeon]
MPREDNSGDNTALKRRRLLQSLTIGLTGLSGCAGDGVPDFAEIGKHLFDSGINFDSYQYWLGPATISAEFYSFKTTKIHALTSIRITSPKKATVHDDIPLTDQWIRQSTIPFGSTKLHTRPVNVELNIRTITDLWNIAIGSFTTSALIDQLSAKVSHYDSYRDHHIATVPSVCGGLNSTPFVDSIAIGSTSIVTVRCLPTTEMALTS